MEVGTTQQWPNTLKRIDQSLQATSWWQKVIKHIRHTAREVALLGMWISIAYYCWALLEQPFKWKTITLKGTLPRKTIMRLRENLLDGKKRDLQKKNYKLEDSDYQILLLGSRERWKGSWDVEQGNHVFWFIIFEVSKERTPRGLPIYLVKKMIYGGVIAWRKGYKGKRKE